MRRIRIVGKNSEIRCVAAASIHGARIHGIVIDIHVTTATVVILGIWKFLRLCAIGWDFGDIFLSYMVDRILIINLPLGRSLGLNRAHE